MTCSLSPRKVSTEELPPPSPRWHQDAPYGLDCPLYAAAAATAEYSAAADEALIGCTQKCSTEIRTVEQGRNDPKETVENQPIMTIQPASPR